MVQRWQVPQVVVWGRLDRRTNQTIRRTCLGRLLLEKGDDGKRTCTLFSIKQERRSDSATTWFSWSKARESSTCQRYAESTCEGKKSIHPAEQSKTKLSTTIVRFRGVRLTGSPSNWTEILTFNKIVFILAMAAEQWMEVEPKLGFVGDLQPGLNSKTFNGRNHKHKETCCTVEPHNKTWFRQVFFSLFRWLFFAAGNFQFPGNRRGVWTEHLLTVRVQVL